MIANPADPAPDARRRGFLRRTTALVMVGLASAAEAADAMLTITPPNAFPWFFPPS